MGLQNLCGKGEGSRFLGKVTVKFFGKRMSKVFKSKQRTGLEVVIHNTKYGEGIGQLCKTVLWGRR